jgi:GNAT superfamily N-acetyltransferase
MTRLILPAAIWEHDLPEPRPCTVCGEPGLFAYTAQATDEPDEPYCSLRHWADKADERVEITGKMTPLPPNLRDPLFQDNLWEVVRQRWPGRGTSGVSSTKNEAGHDVLLYRDQHGRLVAALLRTPKGQLNVIVDPAERGKGIGRALVRAAGRRWPIDLGLQNMTLAGQRLVKHIDPREPS